MITNGQLWVSRRLNELVGWVEEAAGDIDVKDYPTFESWMLDVFDSALNRITEEDYQNEDHFLNKYSSVLSSMEDLFRDQLEDYYSSETKNRLKPINEQWKTEKNLEKLKKFWKSQLKKGDEIRFDKEELEYWGITKYSDVLHAQVAFQNVVGGEKFAEKFIKSLLNKTFSTEEFSQKLVGGYDFQWIINEMKYQDLDFFLYGKTLPGGTVSIMDGRTFKLEEAINDEEIGWEIQEEINEVVQDCMNTIILPKTGEDVTVPLIYIEEE